MTRRRALMCLVLAAVVGALWIGQAVSEEEPVLTERQKRRAEFRKRVQERMRESLGASEEEWKVLQPRIEKVQRLSGQSRFGGMRGMFGRGRRGGRGGDRQRRDAGAARPQSDIQKKTQALRKVLENKDSKAADIKAGLKALREARVKARADLAKAQKGLREVITLRQEGQLVLWRLLD